MRIPKTGEFYRHFKNKLYQIVAVAEHSEDGQKLVIYQALYGDFKVYARPLEMFVSEVDHEKYPDVTQKYRFERVEFADGMLHENAVAETCAEAIKAAEPVACETEQGTTAVQNVAAGTAVVTGTETGAREPEDCAEGRPEPGLLEFLDAENWDMKYNILVSLRDKMTDKLVDDLAVVLDVVIPEGPLDKRYEQLKICLRTRQKYENQHLR